MGSLRPLVRVLRLRYPFWASEEEVRAAALKLCCPGDNYSIRSVFESFFPCPSKLKTGLNERNPTRATLYVSPLKLLDQTATTCFPSAQDHYRLEKITTSVAIQCIVFSLGGHIYFLRVSNDPLSAPDILNVHVSPHQDSVAHIRAR